MAADNHHNPLRAKNALPRRLRRLSQVWQSHRFPRYFVTICTEDRRAVLSTKSFHENLRTFLLSSPSKYGWHPLSYVIMPDHVHLLAVSIEQLSIGRWIKALKAVTAKKRFRWQSGFFDHVLRSGESESAKWEYIRQNPLRAGLVQTADEWPYWGEFRFEAETKEARSPGQETGPT